MTKHITRVCKCEKCGNEAEMVVTCSLPEADQQAPVHEKHEPAAPGSQRVKGTATCSHCGNEADMWVEL
jgi:DNA-directed RNA polymerase subunit M/transcription elongation factor TFIIS